MYAYYSSYALLIDAAQLKGADKWEKAESIARDISRAICIKHIPDSHLITSHQHKQSVVYQSDNAKDSIASLLFEAEIIKSGSLLIRIKQEINIVFSFIEGNLFLDFKLCNLIVEKNFYNHIAKQEECNYFFPAARLAEQYIEVFIPCEELSNEENESLIYKAHEAFWDYMESVYKAIMQYKLAHGKSVTFLDPWMQKNE